MPTRRRASPHLTFIAVAVAAAAVQAAAAAAEARLETLMVAMRDGVELATDVYVPEGGGPWPCILARTPYGKGGNKSLAAEYSARGYAFVSQDCRGKHGSSGRYDPFKTDAEDGHDAVEWAARQPWSNGKIGMIGGSALGITAQLAATQAPPHLLCAYVIVAEASARHQTVYMGGVYRKELNDGWLKAQGADFAIEDSVRQPPGSRYWDWREIPAFHDRIRIPIYQVGGWFDIFSQGSIDNFVGLQSRGAALAAGNQKLVMGPYAHGRLSGRLSFHDGDPAKALQSEDRFRWFDRWLKGIDNGIDREPPVRYYLMGDADDAAAPGNRWVDAASWPPPSRPLSFFLHPDRSLRREPPGEAGASIAYDYDPKKPVPTLGGANLVFMLKGPADQRAIGDRADYLRFQSAPLDAPLEVAGRVHADLWVESDAPDTDFAAKLIDVYPDGYEALLLDGILRARYREGYDREVWLERGKAVPIRIDLWSTAVVFNRGHRIALHISSSNDPRFDPNPNTARPLRADAETRVARNTIHLSAERPSRLLVPMVEVHQAPKAPAGDK
jgi:hypothetical protein